MTATSKGFASSLLTPSGSRHARMLGVGGYRPRRIVPNSEIVGPIVYLASDASSFVTGDDISVSGGMLK